MSKSTAAAEHRKPRKPAKHHPPFAHAAGVWAKKSRGKLHYFGKRGKDSSTDNQGVVGEGRLPPSTVAAAS